MAGTTGKRISWADVRALYDNLNTAQTRFSQSRTAIPDKTKQRVGARDVITIKNEIENLRNVSYVGTKATFDTFTAPRVNELTRYMPLLQIRTKLEEVNAVCAYDGSYNGTYKASNHAYDGSYRASNNAYDGSYNGSYRASNNAYDGSYNGSYRASNNAYDASYDGSYRASNYAYDGGYNGSYRASNDAYRASYNGTHRNGYYAYDGTHRGSNNAYNGSNRSSNNAYNSSNYSSNYTYYTSYRGSNNGTYRGSHRPCSYRGAYTSNSANKSGAGISRS